VKLRAVVPDRALHEAITEFVLARGGGMRPHYAVLCIVDWLQHVGGRAGVSASDVKAIFPRLGDAVVGPLRSPADTMRRARDVGLLEVLGAGCYGITPLGRAVVAALPDAERVAGLRDRSHARCHRRQPAA
jgi:hypothetical protein